MYQIEISKTSDGWNVYGWEFVYVETLSAIPLNIVEAYQKHKRLGNRSVFKNARVYEYNNKKRGKKVEFISASEMRKLMAEVD